MISNHMENLNFIIVIIYLHEVKVHVFHDVTTGKWRKSDKKSEGWCRGVANSYAWGGGSGKGCHAS